MHGNLNWSSKLAYAVGLIASDGNLSRDGRHITFVSKDIEQIQNFCSCVEISTLIGIKKSGYSPKMSAYFVQFSHVNLYRFLISIGLMPNKSKSLGPLNIPTDYFGDFFRGCIDGDGNITVIRHPESKHPQLVIRLYSASLNFLVWVKETFKTVLGIETGWIDESVREYVLCYRKQDSMKIIEYIYSDQVEYFLTRKFKLIESFLSRNDGMVDMSRLGRDARKGVEVQVLFPALRRS